MGRSNRALALLVLLLSLRVGGVGAEENDPYAFMPPGGRSLLLQLTGSDPVALAEIASRSMSREEWRAWAAERQAELEEKAVETFAGYAELNLPLDAAAVEALARGGDTSVLPRDGKDLAVQECQYCHSLFSGYLTHDRDEVGWRAIFKSPFHSEIPMTEVERDTFARYSAINMPVPIEKVPPELRF